MNIIIIDHYAGSPTLGMEFRPYYLGKEWVKMGHKVTIIGASFSHLRKVQPNLGKETIDEIKYIWIKTNRYSGNGIGRVISMLIFVTKLYLNAKKIAKSINPDFVIASSTYPLDIYPARRISKFVKEKKSKLIFEVHDLWPLSPIELGGYTPKHPFIKVMQAAEDYAYKNVDAVVSILPKAFSHMSDHGLSKDKFFYIPNGIVVEDWSYPLPLGLKHYELIQNLHLQNKFIVGFAGAHGTANSLQSIIDAVARIELNNVALVLVGTGQEKNNLIKYVKDKEIKNVYFLEPINKLMIPSLLKEMDVLYVGLQKQSLFRFGISPNKIFDYMMSSKPIIQAIEAGNNLVRDADCGIDVEPECVDEIASAILEIQALSVQDRSRMGENGHNFVFKNHTYDILGKRFIKIMQSI